MRFSQCEDQAVSLYKRPDSDNWWCAFSINGQRIQRSTYTTDKAKAAEYEARLRASLYDQARLGIRTIYTWNEAVIRYRKELDTSNKTDETKDSEVGVLIWLDKFLSGKQLQDIDRDLLDTIIEAKQKEGVKPRTINTYTKQIRQVMRKAMNDWEWIDRVPKFRILTTPKKRVRFITREESDTLIRELPLHLSRMARFSLETGLRRSNVTQLKWSEVDIDMRRAWVHPDDTKNNQPLAVPLTEAATVVLRECLGDDPEFVFVYEGKPVHQVSTAAWYKSLKRCGLGTTEVIDGEDAFKPNFRWHDLRHTWASWHIQEGTQLHELQALGGWETLEMVQKYAHLANHHLEAVVRRRDHIATISTTGKNSEEEKIASSA